MDADSANVVALQLDLASVDGGANLQAHLRRGVADLLRRTDRPFGAIEERHEPVAGRRHLAATESVELGPHRAIVACKQVAPGAVAKLEGTGRRVHDIGHEKRGDDPVEIAALRLSKGDARLPFEIDVRLVAVDPGFVARGDLVELPGFDAELGALARPDAHPAGEADPDVVVLAQLGPRDRLDRFAPAPPGLEDGATDADLAQVVRLEAPERDLAHVVGLAEGPALELDHLPPTIAPLRLRHPSRADGTTVTIGRNSVTCAPNRCVWTGIKS